MLRNGQFENLYWESLANTHGADWNVLQTRHNLPLQQMSIAESLDILAMQSIKACHSCFFVEDEPKNSNQPKLATDSLPVDDLEQYFAPALCDHLIVTFAYRFLCDNLTPMEQSTCLNTLYSCHKDSTIKAYKPGEKGQRIRDADAENSWKRNFSRSRRRTCENHIQQIDRIFVMYKDLLAAICKDKENVDRPRHEQKFDRATIVCPARVSYTKEVEADLTLIDKERVARINKRYEAPTWAYSIAMACNWENSPLAVKRNNLVFVRAYEKGKSILHKLTQFLGSNELGPILFKEAEPESKRLLYTTFAPITFTEEMKTEKERLQRQLPTSLMELRQGQDGYLFVAVPYTPDGTYCQPIPPQSYKIRGTSDRYEITNEIQQMFNAYLIERTFHGYASALIIDCIKARHSFGIFEGHRDQYQKLPSVIRLRAPLLHAAWIRLADEIIPATKSAETIIPWLDSCIDYWNQTSLPLLEEYFVRSVWSSYKECSVNTVLSEIKKALTQGEGSHRRCERLNFYRLIRVDDNMQEPEQDDVLNEVMKNTFLAGLGCKLGQPDGRWVDPGRATAFCDI